MPSEPRSGRKALPEMPAKDPVERSLIASLGPRARLLAGEDPVEMTEAARRAVIEKDELAADPGGLLDPAERATRAAHIRRDRMTRLALKSVQARKARRLADELEAEVAQGLADEVA